MSEDHFDEYEHYNYDQEKNLNSGHGGEDLPQKVYLIILLKIFYPLIFFLGKQRTKKEVETNTNRHNPGGHERKIVTKLMNAEKNHKENEKKSPTKPVAGDHQQEQAGDS